MKLRLLFSDLEDSSLLPSKKAKEAEHILVKFENSETFCKHFILNFTDRLRNAMKNCMLRVWGGAKACQPCRSSSILQTEHFVARRFGFVTAENGPSKFWILVINQPPTPPGSTEQLCLRRPSGG